MCFNGIGKSTDLGTGQVPGLKQLPFAKAAQDKVMAIEDKNIGLRQRLLWGMQSLSKKNKINTESFGVKKLDETDYNDQSKLNNGWFGGAASKGS